MNKSIQTKKQKKQLITIVSAVALFITSIIFSGNPILQSSINVLINTVSHALTIIPETSDTTFLVQ